MRQREIGFQIEMIAIDSPVSLAAHHHKLPARKLLLRDRVTHGNGDVDRQVDDTAGKIQFKIVPVDAKTRERDSRSRLVYAPHQRRQSQGLQHAPHANMEQSRAAGRIEPFLLHAHLKQVQPAANITDDAAAQRRRDHTVSVPDKELVFQQDPETSQTVTDRGLG